MANTIRDKQSAQGQADKARKLPHSGLVKAVELLREGQVVAVPTETVYGLAADGLNPEGVARIFAIKDRPLFDPLILHVLSLEKARELCASFPPLAQALAEAFWPGPLTLVLPKKAFIPDLVTSGLKSVAVRVPAHPVMRALLEAFGGPLAAPSANRFGRISPTTAQAVRTELGDKVSLILDGGACEIGLESTIVSFMAEKPCLLRLGGIPREEIEKIIGAVDQTEAVSAQPQAPGHLKHHYAPQKSLRLLASASELEAGKDYSKTGFLAFGSFPKMKFGKVGQLSKKEDLT